MKNKIEDLRNHLFAQLERLGDEDLKGSALEEEVSRARAINGVAGALIDSARVEVDFMKVTGQEQGSGFMPNEADGTNKIGRD